MLRPLSPIDQRDLQTIHAHLREGDLNVALSRLEALPDYSRDHPDGLFLRALVLQGLGRWLEARKAYEQALVLMPDHPGILNSYGNLLDDLGEGGKAVTALQRSTELQPSSNDTWINLGIAAIGAGQFDVAEAALARAIRAAPGVARGWAAMGLLEQQRGNSDLAADLYSRALAIDPEEVRSRHNLATLLRKADRPEEALEEAEIAVRMGPVPPETAVLRAHLLADVNRTDEAAEEYRSIVRQIPDQIEAHETLARLLPQIGRGAEALDGYREALRAQPDSEPLWGSALRSALALHDYVQLAAWGQEAEALLGPRPDLRILRAAALSRMGNQHRAIEFLREVIGREPAHGPAHQHLAHCLLAAGDPKAAATHALRATRIDPFDQAAWALLTVIWRVLNDTRELWLADYERLVMTVDLDAAPGFFDELSGRLNEWHMMRAHPMDHPLRGGTRTRGHLFDRKDPLVARLVGQIRTGVQQCLRALPDDSKHPFLSRKAVDLDFPGSWSVRLGSRGFHNSHFHPHGWMSSALYVSLPAKVEQGNAGAITFGTPDPALGLDLPPRRTVEPQVGRLILFPSFFWHATLPSEGDEPRLAVAFDALPVDTKPVRR